MQKSNQEHSIRDIPNIHTSLDVVNRRKFIDSGAIHLMGNLPFVAANFNTYKMQALNGLLKPTHR
jgi:hypothetical protein